MGAFRVIPAKYRKDIFYMTAYNPQDKFSVLKSIYGYDHFREGQEKLIDTIMEGVDVVGVMPTGAGKSICYQIPALMLPGITLVISPLISLMKDQVMALKANGVAAAYINSSLTPGQQAEALRRARLGTYKIIYVAPERLMTPGFLSFAQNTEISFLAVDEAHCVSQWGHDFRPSYLHIADFVDQLPQRPKLAAFTATATHEVRTDIIRQLRLREPFCKTTGFNRPNLRFSCVKPTNKYNMLVNFLETMPQDCGIIYCSTRKTVEEVTRKLQTEGFSVARYHAGLSDEERRQSQDDFLYDRSRLIVATNAFGMGIDKSNVRFVVHYNMPMNLESYYQEAGRAGRDGLPSECLLLYSGQDVVTGKWMLERGEPNPEMTPEQRRLVRARDEERLKQMTFYATSTKCLRAFILRYFGETDVPETCDYCSVCAGEEFEVDTGPSRASRTASARSASRAEKRVEKAARREERKKKADSLTPWEAALLQNLKTLRLLFAQENKVPAFVICSDATLLDMIRLKPSTLEEMMRVSGMGEIKVEYYGRAFLAVLRDGKEPNDAFALDH